MNKFDIVAFGEILIDFTRMGETQENQKLFAQNAGGAPANVLVCATKLGKNTAFLGKVGNDMHGKFLKDTLIYEKVNTDGLIMDDNYFTTLAFVDINENGERSFSFARKHGADTFMTKEEINLEILQNCKIFHIGSLSLTTKLSKETTLYAIEKAKESGALISYDPNYRASLWESEKTAKLEMQSIIKYADIMKISDEECKLLTGETEPLKAAKILNDQGVKIVCVTLGKDGCLVSTSKSQEFVKGFKPLKVADTTGAGDSFWGSFLSKVSVNDSIEEIANSARFANSTASICVERPGAIRAMPSLDEVLNRLNS